MTVLIERPRLVDTRIWTRACRLDVLLPGRGVAVLLPDGEQAALFRLADGTLAAVSSIDPFGHAAVMSRGITGDRRGEPTVATPLLKQVFTLRDGRCLDDVPGGGAKRPGDDQAHALTVYDVRVTDGIVEVARR
jgi:nitrite reductase (NADH) small subunit